MTDTLESTIAPLVARVAKQLVAELLPVVHEVAREGLRRALDGLDVPDGGGRAKPRAPVRKSKAAPPKPKRASRYRVVERDAKPPRAAPGNRPCGCGPRGRHLSTCTASKVSAAAPKVVAPDAPPATSRTPKMPTDAVRDARFARIEEAAAKRRAEA